MVSDLADIYSPENIARSRARAAQMRADAAAGILPPEWAKIADDVEAYATQREQERMP